MLPIPRALARPRCAPRPCKTRPSRGSSCGLSLLLALATACHARPSIDELITLQPLTGSVDPMIGSLGPGNVIPGAMVPHGMIKLGPDTSQTAIESYEYSDPRILGFPHTHLEGPGGVTWMHFGYSELLVMPQRGALAIDPAGYSSSYSHASETARPGYYAVDLDDEDARAELTATARCGVHRYTFNGSEPGRLILDVGYTRGAPVAGNVAVTGSTLEGSGTYVVHPNLALVVDNIDPSTNTGQRTLYFHAELNRAPDSVGVWADGAAQDGVTSAKGTSVGAYANWQAPGVVELRLCISFIDLAQARRAFTEEVQGQSFDDLAAAADTAWNQKLNRIQLEGGSDDERKIFYTALYHAHAQPTDYTEDGRFWSGYDSVGAVSTTQGHYFSDDWAIWDTFRTLHPLQLLLEPQFRDDMVRSLLVPYQQGGWLEKSTWQATGYSRIEFSSHAVDVISDAWLKGFRNWDSSVGYAAALKSQTQEDELFDLPPFCGLFTLGTPPEYSSLGYVSYDCDNMQSTSMTLEIAATDYSLSRFAQALGNKTDAATFAKLALNYQNQWNDGFMQSRLKSGDWLTPFDPTAVSSSNGLFEDSAWTWTLNVPHDVRGLANLMGGSDALVAYLDAYFAGGYDDPSNEPGFLAPWLYLYAGQPAKTQAHVRALLANYTSAPDGLPGNDDAGTLSAYAVWSALGLYPMPGEVYLIGSPIFSKATLWLDPAWFAGDSFVIEATNASDANVYVQSATLNGKPWNQPWLSHAQLAAGGTLALVMGPAPSAWGSDPAAAPPSLSDP